MKQEANSTISNNTLEINRMKEFSNDIPLDLSSHDQKTNVSGMFQETSNTKIKNVEEEMEIEFEKLQSKAEASVNLLEQNPTSFSYYQNYHESMKQVSGYTPLAPTLGNFSLTSATGLQSSRRKISSALPNSKFLQSSGSRSNGLTTPTPRFPEQMRVELQQENLWQQFHQRSTEMIITKVGRWVEASIRVGSPSQ